MSAYDIVVMCDGPIRYCELGDLSGTNAKDSSASGQNGTIHGTVLYKALRPDQIAAHYRAGLSAQFIQAHRSFIDVRGYN